MDHQAEHLSGYEKFNENDELFMKEAFKEAQLALDRGEVPIGCVFIKDAKTILTRGGNETNARSDATRHAELVALEKIDAENEEGLDLYVTIEPCIMCAEALILTKVKRVVYGAPNDKFGGCGSVLAVNNPDTFPNDSQKRSFQCESGLGAQEAVDLLRQFYMRSNAKAPHPRPDGMATRIAKRQNLKQSSSPSKQHEDGTTNIVDEEIVK